MLPEADSRYGHQRLITSTWPCIRHRRASSSSDAVHLILYSFYITRVALPTCISHIRDTPATSMSIHSQLSEHHQLVAGGRYVIQNLCTGDCYVTLVIEAKARRLNGVLQLSVNLLN